MNTAPPDGSPRKCLPAPIHRGIDRLVSLIRQLRGILHPERMTADVPPLLPAVAQQPAVALPAVPVPPPPTTLTDEDGDVSDLPLEFATATMGHLLVDQGRLDESRRVFESVLARQPQDPEALRGLQRLGVAVSTSRDVSKPAPQPDTVASASPPQAQIPQPAGLLDRAPLPEGYGVSEARALPVDPASIVVFWEVTEETLAAAREHLGWGSVLSLCVVSLRGDTPSVSRSERYIDDVPPLGDWFVTGLPTGATHHAAVGLHRGSEFFPLTHAAAVTTPRGGPATTDAQVRATVDFSALASTDSFLHGPRITTLTGPEDALARALGTVSPRVSTVLLPDAPGATSDDAWHRAHAQWSAGNAPSSDLGVVGLG